MSLKLCCQLLSPVIKMHSTCIPITGKSSQAVALFTAATQNKRKDRSEDLVAKATQSVELKKQQALRVSLKYFCDLSSANPCLKFNSCRNFQIPAGAKKKLLTCPLWPLSFSLLPLRSAPQRSGPSGLCAEPPAELSTEMHQSGMQQ